MAKRLMCVSGNGRITFDYDMKIAEPFSQPGDDMGLDLWPAFKALEGRPMLVLRGELSDLLSDATFRRMEAEIAGDGDRHRAAASAMPPRWTNPIALEAIARLLAKVAR